MSKYKDVMEAAQFAMEQLERVCISDEESSEVTIHDHEMLTVRYFEGSSEVSETFLLPDLRGANFCPFEVIRRFCLDARYKIYGGDCDDREKAIDSQCCGDLECPMERKGRCPDCLELTFDEHTYFFPCCGLQVCRTCYTAGDPPFNFEDPDDVLDPDVCGLCGGTGRYYPDPDVDQKEEENVR